MHYLREGLICLESPRGALEVLDIDGGPSTELDAAVADLVKRLIRGLEGQEALEARELLGSELVQKRDEPFDRVVRRHLAALDRSFSWIRHQGQAPLIAISEIAHSLLRHARQDLDQLPVLPETAARRARLLADRLPPGATVALVGDDDLVAIPAAALGLKPTVFDLDPDLIATVELLAHRLGLEIAVQQLDLREPLPVALRGTFDAFCTDPETSRECIGLFLSRGAALARPGGLGLLACAEEWSHLVDEAIERSSLSRLERLRRFGNYRDPLVRLSHYRSDLHVVAVTETSQPLVGVDETFTEQLFTFGLTSGAHLVGTALRCSADVSTGSRMVELAKELIGGGPPPVVHDRCPAPIRVVTAETKDARAQLTLRADGQTVDIDLHPAPINDAEARRVLAAITRSLSAEETRLQTLQRLE